MKIFTLIFLNIFCVIMANAQNLKPFTPPPNNNRGSGFQIEPKINPYPGGLQAEIEATKRLYNGKKSQLEAFGTYKQDFTIQNRQFNVGQPYAGAGLRFKF